MLLKGYSSLISCISLALLLSFNASAEDSRIDYDIDGDGLIEINDLQDLNEMRNHLNGSALYGDSTGCPEDGCAGFELTTDLDFDTNQDGVMDANDEYWNEGLGWEPIGNSSDTALLTEFNGNGNLIRNLYINRPTTDYIGLFGYIYEDNAKIHKIGLTGSLMRIVGDDRVGAIAGFVTSGASIEQSFNTGKVTGDFYVGGIVGYLNSATATHNFSTGDVSGRQYVGGLLGYIKRGATHNNFATGKVSATSYPGGIIGYVKTGFLINNEISNSYWALDTTKKNTSAYMTNSESYFGTTLQQMQCPTTESNTACPNTGVLYADWSSEIWDFGSSEQLPGLRFGNTTYRDSDGDGVLDSDDVFPYEYAASQGSIEDGIADFYNPNCNTQCIIDSGLALDQFPENIAVSLDTDLDGLPDAWSSNCDIDCQINSGLNLDSHPNDSDNDGIPNNIDTDDNNDGVRDADADSNGLIEVHTLEQLYAIRFNLTGRGRVLIEDTPPDTSGCPAITIEDSLQSLCLGYELTKDLDFDTNQDGVMDDNDTYWNDGLGWEPIGLNSDSPFISVFNGQGHVIKNLYINRPDTSYVGLFGYVQGELSALQNIGLNGSMMNITGSDNVGALVGATNSGTDINQVFSMGVVTGNTYVGGLVGSLYSSTMSNGFSTGKIIGDSNIGSLIGRILGSIVSHSFSSAYSEGDINTGGVIGSFSISRVEGSHWSTDTTQQESNSYEDIKTNYFSTTLKKLQCPIASNNTTCPNTGTLYNNWSTEVWDFGYNDQLPGLIFGNTIYRDSDGDGVIDTDDVLPFEFAASQDKDNDGFVDFYTQGCDISCVDESGLILDQFPASGAVSLDADLDGLPDRWNSSCDIYCQSTSGIIIDTYLDDSDNDGIPNSDDSDDTNDGMIDADADSDGLIDINNIEQLNAMRFDLNGHGRLLSEGEEPDHSGCPFIVNAGVKQPLCNGYELTVNIDFDTNQDGIMDNNDLYWNDGDGWHPVGTNERAPFTATFDGNGHVIRNLYINPLGYNDYYIGLFGYVSGEFVELRNLILSGPSMSIKGAWSVGALAGHAGKGVQIQKIFSTGRVSGDSAVGGIVGSLDTGSLSQSFTSGTISGYEGIGGLIGYALNSTLHDNITTTYVSGTQYVGKIIGFSSDMTTSTTYGATDITQDSPTNSNNNASYFGATLAQLQCPTSPTNNNCSDEGTLYEGWNNSIWDFGTFNQLPGLIFGSTIYRDSDGDGSLDEDDGFPTVFAASVDNDNDGYPDSITGGCDIDCLNQSGLIFDQFTGDPSAGKDTDFDGLPDEWSPGCDLSCQNSSSLTLDPYINDSDNDGITNTNDTDDNNDGIPNADIDSNGLIEINNLSQLNAMRFNLSGSGRVLEEGGDADQSGCPIIVNSNIVQPMCSGYELAADLNFDTNQDGVMDSNDTYWNDGLGWESVGNKEQNAFKAVFNGNGHVIQNLYINRPTAYGTGLFGFVSGGSSELSNIALTGSLMKISGGALVGALAGQTSNGSIIKNTFSNGVVQGSNVVGGLIGFLQSSTLKQSFSSSPVTATEYAGGLIGIAYDSEISNSFTLGSVSALNKVGGLVGYILKGLLPEQEIYLLDATSTISNSYAIGEVAGEYYVGGLIGESNDLAEITHSYWATDTTTQLNSDGEDEFTGYIGTTLDELKCPTSANNTSCVLNTNMYDGWDSDIWHFGNESELPGLIIGDLIYRNEAPISIEDWDIENQQFESITPISNAPAIENTNNEARSTGGSGGGSVNFLWWVILSSGLAATRKTLAR